MPELTAAPHKPGPHPAAPQEIVDNFAAFSSKSQAGASSSSSSTSAASSSVGAYGTGFLPASKKPYDYENFYEAPAYYWQHNELTEREIEAVMVSRQASGGAASVGCGVAASVMWSCGWEWCCASGETGRERRCEEV